MEKAGHSIIIGSRNPGDEKYAEPKQNGIQVLDTVKAVERAEIVLIALPAGWFPTLRDH